MKPKKRFDCVAMQHRAQQRIRAELEGKSHEEEIAYFRSGADEFQRCIGAAKNAGQKKTKWCVGAWVSNSGHIFLKRAFRPHILRKTAMRNTYGLIGFLISLPIAEVAAQTKDSKPLARTLLQPDNQVKCEWHECKMEIDTKSKLRGATVKLDDTWELRLPQAH